jgi:hypothetical protein
MTSSKIDPKAATCTNQDHALREAMRTLRPPRSKLTPAGAATKPVSKGSKKAKSKHATPVGLEGLENETPTLDLKSQLTLKERRFIELYLTGDLTVDKAMESAGYEGYHKKSLYRLGRKIVEKYESQAGDHRKIFRSIGAGEVAVAKGLLKLATTAKSEMVRLNAWATIAKCLGLQKEQVDAVTGISIVINTGQPAPTGPGPDGGRPALIHQEPKLVPRAISIIK